METDALDKKEEEGAAQTKSSHERDDTSQAVSARRRWKREQRQRRSTGVKVEAVGVCRAVDPRPAVGDAHAAAQPLQRARAIAAAASAASASAAGAGAVLAVVAVVLPVGRGVGAGVVAVVAREVLAVCVFFERQVERRGGGEDAATPVMASERSKIETTKQDNETHAQQPSFP